MSRDIFKTTPCIRIKQNLVSESEEHFCYFCGFPIPLKTGDCGTCNIMKCPTCGKCLCNISDEEYGTLKAIHLKYCCNVSELATFSEISGISGPEEMLKNCEKALKYCSEKFLNSYGQGGGKSILG